MRHTTALIVAINRGAFGSSVFLKLESRVNNIRMSLYKDLAKKTHKKKKKPTNKQSSYKFKKMKIRNQQEVNLSPKEHGYSRLTEFISKYSKIH